MRKLDAKRAPKKKKKAIRKGSLKFPAPDDRRHRIPACEQHHTQGLKTRCLDILL